MFFYIKIHEIIKFIFKKICTMKLALTYFAYNKKFPPYHFFLLFFLSHLSKIHFCCHQRSRLKI